jgi:hypothetical protein
VAARAELEPGERLHCDRVDRYPGHVADERGPSVGRKEGAHPAVEARQIGPLKRAADRDRDRAHFGL